MSRVIRRAFLVAVAACVGFGGHQAFATEVCAEHLLVGRLCVQDDPSDPLRCEQTGALATCDILEDPCHRLSLCLVCPTNDPCGPPLAEW